MKLVRYIHSGRTAVGALQEGRIVDLSGLAPEGSMRRFLDAGKPALDSARARAASAGSSVPAAECRLLAPLADPRKIMCIGQNYRDHCEEQNQPIPDRAIMFSKFDTALSDPEAAVYLPAASQQVDYEAELAFVIGKTGKNIAESEAMRHVAGYLCANDISARDIQFGDKQWVRGKSPDGFFPIGPWLVTADEIADPHALDISLTLNGAEMQRSNTSNLIFRIPYLIAYLSQTMTLLPGDIVSTGTPGGVGVFRKPPVFLKPGDSMSVTIAGLGTLTNSVQSA